MEKTQLKKLINEAMQELEAISKANLPTECLQALHREIKANEEIEQDVILRTMLTEVTKRGGMISKNLKSTSTASRNALTYANEALSKLK